MTTAPEIGSALPAWEIASVDPARMQTMAALLDDSNPIHFDVHTLRRLGMGDRPVNQGPSNLGYIHNMLESWAGRGAVRRVRVRFVSNVHAGDRVTAGGTVTDVRRVDDAVLVDCDVRLDIAGGEPALIGTATVAWRGETS